MTAKWEQEKLKAAAVTIAEKVRDSSELMAAAAAFIKKEQTLLGEGEGARKRAVMMANGALEQKIEAWKFAQQVWADAFAKYGGSIVPQIVSGGSGTGTNGQNGMNQIMEMIGIQAAKSLSLDMKNK
jgi:hypothetical protein